MLKIYLTKFKTFSLIISIFLVIYIFYSSEIKYNGEIRHYYLNYYVVSIALTLSSVIFFFINEKYFFYIKQIIIYSIVTLYSFEVFISYKTSFDLKKILEFKKMQLKQQNLVFDERSKYEYYNFHKKEINKNVVVTVQPNNFIANDFKEFSLLPLSGISKKETIFANENGYWSTYYSDRYGFNNLDFLWNESKINYLITGDSFAHGSAVKFDEGISAVINKISNKKSINIGYGGNGPLLRHAALKEYIYTGIKFEKVLWLHLEGDDLFNLINEKKNEKLIKYFDNESYSQDLINKQDEIDIINSKIIETVELNYLKNLNKEKNKNKIKEIVYSFVKLNQTRNIIFKNDDINTFRSQKKISDDIYKFFEKLIEKEKIFLDKMNVELIFVYIPEYKRYSMDNYKNASYSKVINIVKNSDIKIIDLHKDFLFKEKNPKSFFPFGLPGHFNKEGYKKIAEIIVNKVN